MDPISYPPDEGKGGWGDRRCPHSPPASIFPHQGGEKERDVALVQDPTRPRSFYRNFRKSEAGVLFRKLRHRSAGEGKSWLTHGLTPMRPAMTLTEAIETIRVHRVTGLSSGRTALVTHFAAAARMGDGGDQ
jgi:hypothetical protein